MNQEDKIVSTIPMLNIWNDEGPIEAIRKRDLSLSDLKAMLSKCPVEFVVANVGHHLEWISVNKCFEFWKFEVKSHIVHSPDIRFSLENFPGEYAYVASEWSGEFQAPVVLLEMYH